MDITSFILGFQKGKAAGGGALTEDVCHVTFMNGNTLLYEKPVFVGDDCTDIVKKGTIGTPSKASTPQYTYTYTGWSLTNGGEASTNALAAVSGDRTVYAAYASAVRYYTVTYLDEDGSVLKTESLAYGAMPSYVPTKDGYNFIAWSPNAPVTGDMTYTATWKVKPTFETASWSEIAEICESGQAADTFAVGQEKPITITYADGTTEENVLIIAAIDTTIIKGDITAGITLMAKYALSSKRRIANAFSYSFITETELGLWLDSDFFSALPSDLQSVIKGKRLGGLGTNIKYGKCWLPALEELGLTKTNYTNGINVTLSAFPLFTSASDRIRTLGKNGAETEYWTKNTYNAGMYTHTAYITTAGTVYSGEGYTPKGTSGVVVGICI